MYTIKLQTPTSTHHINNLTEDDTINFQANLASFLLDDTMALFTIEVPEGTLILPYNILMNTEITIY